MNTLWAAWDLGSTGALMRIIAKSRQMGHLEHYWGQPQDGLEKAPARRTELHHALSNPDRLRCWVRPRSGWWAL